MIHRKRHINKCCILTPVIAFGQFSLAVDVVPVSGPAPDCASPSSSVSLFLFLMNFRISIVHESIQPREEGQHVVFSKQ